MYNKYTRRLTSNILYWQIWQKTQGHTNDVSTVVALYLNPWCWPGWLWSQAEAASQGVSCRVMQHNCIVPASSSSSSQQHSGVLGQFIQKLYHCSQRYLAVLSLCCFNASLNMKTAHKTSIQDTGGNIYNQLVYSNVCGAAPDSRRQLTICLNPHLWQSCIGALSECWIYSASWSSRDPAAVMTHHWLVRPPRCGRLVCVKPPISVPRPTLPCPSFAVACPSPEVKHKDNKAWVMP